MGYRDASPDQRRLLLALLAKAHLEQRFINWLDQLMVEPLDDGGMGSFRITAAAWAERRQAGPCIAELQFEDADGVLVLASLYADVEGQPCEVDIWKVNFEPLIRIPAQLL